MKRKPLSIAREIVLGFALLLAMAHAKGVAMIVAAEDVRVIAHKHVALVVAMIAQMDASKVAVVDVEKDVVALVF